jgi:hypothetical protein
VECYLELFLGAEATEISEKIQSVGFVSGARLCQEHTVSATANNFFHCENRITRESLKYSIQSLVAIVCQNRARKLSVLPRSGPAVGPRPAETRGPETEPRRPIA